MNIFTAAAVLQLLLAVGGSDVQRVNKRIGCYYRGLISESYRTVYPEDIDASICTHLIYLNGAINNDTQEIIIKPPSRDMKTGGEGFVPRLAKLKRVNPKLKLILDLFVMHPDLIPQEPSGRSNIIQNGIKWLNETGFDGFEISDFLTNAEETEKMADFICEMKKEFDKFGYTVMTSITGPLEESLSKIARCSDQVGLIVHHMEMETQRMAPMSLITPIVEWMVGRGVPANKISVTVPAFGLIFTLKDPNDTKMGAAITGPGNDNRELFDGVGISNIEEPFSGFQPGREVERVRSFGNEDVIRDSCRNVEPAPLHDQAGNQRTVPAHYSPGKNQIVLLRKSNDSSLGWTIRRDNETKEPYAFSTTGLWTSYEDTTSMEYKARYVLERGLGGIDILGMDYEDDEGIGGEGTFPLTRTAYNTLRGGNQPVNTGN